MKIKNFKKGDWITTDDGKIAQIIEKDDEYGTVTYDSGYIQTTTPDDSEVYPFNLHNKVIAEAIDDYMTKFHRKGILYPKTGRRIREFGTMLYNLPENAEAKQFKFIYKEIDEYMAELESHIKYFKD